MNPTVFLLFLANLLTNALSNTPVPNGPDVISGTPTSNLSDLSPKGCFLPDPTKSQAPIVFADCATGIIRDQMSTYPDMGKFLIWSRAKTSTTDIKVPYVRYSGTCALVLNVQGQDEYERDSFGDVVQTAMILARDCVIAPPHRGGQADLGSRGKLQMTIIRRPGYPGNDGSWLQGNGSDNRVISGGMPDESLVNVS